MNWEAPRMGTWLPKAQSCRLHRAQGRVTILDATPKVYFMWVLGGPAGGSGWGLLLLSSHSVQSPWLWGLSLSSSQPQITLPSTTWAESAAFPHSQQKWHCCVLLAFVIFWKCYQSPSWYAFIFGALFQESFNVKRSFLQSTVFGFSILALLTLRGRVCFVAVGEVQLKFTENNFQNMD